MKEKTGQNEKMKVEGEGGLQRARQGLAKGQASERQGQE